MPTPKISPQKVKLIKKLLAEGKTQREVAKEAGVAAGTVAKTKAGSHDSSPMPDPTNQKINELEGKLHQRAEEVRYLNKKLKSAQSKAVDFDAIVDHLQSMVTPLQAPSPMLDFDADKSEVSEDVGLILSDGHWDALISKRNNNGMEDFSPEIALARAEHLTSTLVEWCIGNLSKHKFDRLWLFGLGDFGNYRIHGAEKHSAHKNAIKSALWAGQLLSLIASDLSQYFPRVSCTFVPGNHGRQGDVAKKDYQEPSNSYDYLAAKTSQIYCTDCDRIDFAIPDSFTTFVVARGWNFHCSHGDDIQSNRGIPWYGVDRKTLKLVQMHAAVDRKIDATLMGHFHEGIIRPNRFPRMIVNGAFPATDPFANNACDGYSDPMQIAFGIHDHRPISWTLPIFLKGGNDKREGRYVIDITE
jgi:transcriptional regulator with XRE-family HTH domain